MSESRDYQINPQPSPELTVFPRTNDISINGSDLKIMMRDYKDAVRNEITFPIVIAVLSLWTPVFTSDFKALFGLTAEQVQVGYTMIAIIFTISLLKVLLISTAILILRLLSLFGFENMVSRKLQQYETDPDRKVEQIMDLCKTDQVIVKVSGLKIVQAQYGAGTIAEDVTEKIRGLVSDGVLDFTVSNALVSKDPTPGIPKTLQVIYSFGGETQTKKFPESTRVVLP